MRTIIQDLPLSLTIFLFCVSAVLVWLSGVRLSKYADKIIEKTGTSEIFIGTLGLATITSLPEVATTLSASLANNADLAINNLLGSISLQITILAIGDALIGYTSLSGILENPVSRLQAICLTFLLSLTAIAILYSDFAIFHVGFWSIILFIFYVGLFYLVSYFKGIRWWLTEPEERESIGKVKAIVSERLAEREQTVQSEEKPSENKVKVSLFSMLSTKVGFFSLLAAVAVLFGGYIIATSADIIANKTGLGSGFMGFFFIGLTTSLPELSTTIVAIKLKRYRMAFSNIFGTNLLNIGLILVADIFFFDGPVLNEVSNFAAVAAMLGIMLTSIYQVGLTLKFKKTFFRLGFDSLLVVLFYIAGAIILFNMRSM